MLERYAPPSTSRPVIGPSLSADVDRRRLEASRLLPLSDKAQLGQFMTPATIAEFMASLFSPLNRSEIRLLDPGAGVGSLAAAFVQRACHEPTPPQRLTVTAYEVDPNLAASLRTTLEECTHLASAHEIDLTYELLPFDFIEHATEALSGGLFSNPAIVYARHHKSTLQEDQQPISSQTAVAKRRYRSHEPLCCLCSVIYSVVGARR